jgi:hypothetical protein
MPQFQSDVYPTSGASAEILRPVAPGNPVGDYADLLAADRMLNGDTPQEVLEAVRGDIGTWLADTYPSSKDGQLFDESRGRQAAIELVDRLRWGRYGAAVNGFGLDASQMLLDATARPTPDSRDRLSDLSQPEEALPILRYVPEEFRDGMARQLVRRVEEAPVRIVSPEISTEVEPTVRAATRDDLEYLVRIELDAFHDVYGEHPSQEKAEEIRNTYIERLKMFGDLVRVLEHPERGVYGMIVYCRTNNTRQDFLDENRDMTQNGTLEAIHDPEGRNAYVVTLGVMRKYQGQSDHFRLFADGIRIAGEEGVRDVFFESRLPAFEKWAERQLTALRAGGEFEPTMDELADQYWHLRKEKYGQEVPLDPLLRLYVSFGAVPLRLIKDAWKPDSSSEGYGVLCEFTIPEMGGSAKASPEPSNTPDRTLEVEGVPEQHLSFMRRTVEWAKAHKKGLFLGATALAGLGYSLAQGGVSEIIDKTREEAPELAAAYGASLVAFFGGAALMLAGAGQKIRASRLFSAFRKQDLENLPNGNRLVRTGFWINAAGATAAGLTAVAAIVKTLPPSAWSALAVPLADLYSTFAIRSPFVQRMSAHQD